ncbi:MAG: hypothetical protein HYX59_01820 [Elusimicrobia bacterium]|nr:hypothetical protein [Elusimicrobiota bacterium]
MKVSLKTIALMAALGLIANVASAQLTGKAITGSKHDFKTAGYVGENGVTFTAYNKCSTCHAAHKPNLNSPLWARALGAGGAWTVWDGAAGAVLDGSDAELLTEAQFATTGSAMCLSCHDGVTAIGGTTMKASFRGNWGRNLSDTHPIARVVDFGTPGMQTDLASGNLGSGSNVVVDVVGGKSYVGCTSCHSMHSSANSPKILRAGERCLSCHNR